MNEISTNVKPQLNFFQRIRLNLFEKRKNITYELYEKAPNYCQESEKVVRKLIVQNQLTEEQILKIPDLINYILNNNSGEIFNLLSVKSKIELINKNKKLIDILNDEEKNILIAQAIGEGHVNFLDFINKYGGERALLEELKKQDLLEKCLPRILQHLSIRENLVRAKPDLIVHLSENEQKKLFEKEKTFFMYISQESQLKYLNEHPDYFRYATVEAKELFISMDDNNVKKIPANYQLELVRRNSEYYDKIEYKVQNMIWNSNDSDATKAAIAMLKKDIKNSKKLFFVSSINNSYEQQYKKSIRNINPQYFELFDNIENESIDKVLNLMLHSKLMNAIGKLSDSEATMHSYDNSSNASEALSGIDAYNDKQIEIIHRLSIEQMAELVKIDNNYVLPYSINNASNILPLFEQMFGKEMAFKYKDCIEKIIEMQLSYDNKMKQLISNETRGEDFVKLKNTIPLEELKILFNEKIIKENSPEKILEYLTLKENGKLAEKEFRDIIEKAYGENARQILEKRENLDVHAINSLEVFDEKILGEFGEAFVHDLISYNFRDFSEFLEVIKNSNKRKDFKDFYEILTQINGSNVETMQKTITEYHYYSELLETIRDKELTDKQNHNLLAVLCSKCNYLDIKTMDELENYDNIANTKLLYEMERILEEKFDNDKNLNQASKNMALRMLIARNILGVELFEDRQTNYGDSIEFLSQMYDLQDEALKKDIYSDSERKILEVIDYLYKDNLSKPESLVGFAKQLINEDGIRNPVTLYTAIGKTKREQTRILNSELTNIEEIDKVCEQQKNESKPLAYKEIDEKTGVTIYHLTGMPYTMLAHDKGNVSDELVMSYEGQGGNSAICSRVVNEKMGSDGWIGGKLLYLNLDDADIITANGSDANTQHMSKRIRNIAQKRNVKITGISKIKNTSNEVSFYRRYRNHKKINNENRGGRRMPDAIGIDHPGAIIPPIAIKYGLPVICIHYDAYQNKEILRENNSISRIEKNEMEI